MLIKPQALIILLLPPSSLESRKQPSKAHLSLQSDVKSRSLMRLLIFIQTSKYAKFPLSQFWCVARRFYD